MLSLMMLSGSAMAQMTEQREPSMRPKRVRMTQEQMTEKMISELKLDEKQAKKVTKLNKKFKTLIEGEQQENMKDQRPPMGQGRPDGNRGGGRPGGSNSQQASYDYDKQQSKYDEQMRKLLSDEQYEGYMKLKPQFYSQRRVREFLMGGNSMSGEMGMPPGGFGGHGSRQKDIKYSGATSLTAATIETGKTYESSKIDECALLISTKEAVTVSQPTISKTGDSDGGDNCSFYGVNAALLVKGGIVTVEGGS